LPRPSGRQSPGPPGPRLLFGLIPLFVGLAQIILALMSGATFAGWRVGVPPASMYPPPGERPTPAPPQGPASNLAGVWELKLDFLYGSASHKLTFEQEGGRLVGAHQCEFASGDLTGAVAGNRVRFQSSLPTDGTRVSFQFEGTEQGGKLAGTVGLGEYGEARWTAERHAYRTGGGRRG